MNRLSEGYVLGERYGLTRRIAVGGMGEVWDAFDSVLQRSVAVKVMRPSMADEQVFAKRFRAEAMMAASLSHPNIATVFDYGEHQSLAFLVMELVLGEPLSDRVRREGALPAQLVRSIVRQAALALMVAHERGVVHRDIKPANVMITPHGAVKLTDFGIARALDGSSHTRTGEVLGTPFYISPEQALGRAASAASDLYALGVVAHELLSGKRPFDRGTPVATALSHVNEPPPPLPPDTPPDLAEVISACLHKDPGLRPANARAVAGALVLDASALFQEYAPGDPSHLPGSAPGPAESGVGATPRPWATREAQAAAMTDPATPNTIPMGWPAQDAFPKPLTDLDELLANLNPVIHEGTYALVSTPSPPPGVRPYFTVMEPEGLTMLLRGEDADALGLTYERPVAWIILGVRRAIGALGYVPALTTALAQARIPSVAAAGRFHTHLFVPDADRDRAMKVLHMLWAAHQPD